MSKTVSHSHLAFRILLVAVGAALIPTGAWAQQIQLKPGATPGKIAHNAHTRDYAYCEIVPVLGQPPNLMAEFYNTSAPGDHCPADKWAALDQQKLAEELGTKFLYLNPTPLTARRHWVMDELWLYKAGESVDFHGAKGTWCASMTAEVLKQALGGDYAPGEIHRVTKYLYKKGSQVFLMHDSSGKTWVMQSYATEVNKDLTFDKLPQLATLLSLPSGFTFEVKTLDKDLTIEPGKAGGVAHIIRDNLHDVYEGCGFDAACSFTP